MAEWLQQLKPGDKVIVDDGGKSLHTIERLTATQIVLKNPYGLPWRFQRDSGRQVGGGSSWRSPILREATPEAVELVRLKLARDRIGRVNPEALTDDQVRRIYAILKEGDGNGKA